MGIAIPKEELTFSLSYPEQQELIEIVNRPDGIETLRRDFPRKEFITQGVGITDLEEGDNPLLDSADIWENVVDTVDLWYRKVGEEAPDLWDEILYKLDLIADHVDISCLHIRLDTKYRFPHHTIIPGFFWYILPVLEDVQFWYLGVEPDATKSIIVYFKRISDFCQFAKMLDKTTHDITSWYDQIPVGTSLLALEEQSSDDIRVKPRRCQVRGIKTVFWNMGMKSQIMAYIHPVSLESYEIGLYSELEGYLRTIFEWNSQPITRDVLLNPIFWKEIERI